MATDDRAERLRRWARANGYAPDPHGFDLPDAPARMTEPEPVADNAGYHGFETAADEPDDFTVLDIETTAKVPWRGDLICAGIGETAHAGDEGRRAARELLSRPGVVVCHTSFDLRWLALDGAELHPDLRFHDTRVMGWLLDGNESLALDDLCSRWLGYVPPKLIKSVGGRLMFQTRGKPSKSAVGMLFPGVEGWHEPGELVPIEEAPWDEMRAYNESDLRATRELYEALRSALEAEGLWELFLHDEEPLSGAILDMETAGLPFDLDACGKLRDHVAGEADELASKLRVDGGLPPSFNLGSTKQVADYIFGKGAVRLDDRVELDPAAIAFYKKAKADWHDGLPAPLDALNASGLLPKGFVAEKAGRLYAHGFWTVQGRDAIPAEAGFGASVHWKEAHRERTRPSTSSLSLVLKNPDDEWIGDLVLWRELTKLHTSFLAKFPDYASGGRLYGTLNRTGTATGRFSSSEPNLQQIPAHGNYGAHVRGLFRGDLALGDYSQLEQRIAAHLSLDENLVKAYMDEVDLYGLAASILFGGEASKDHPQRGLMKTGMLALQYGAGANKLAQLMLVDGHEDATKEKAQDLIAQLESVFPRFFAWREEVIARAAADGYVETLSGRRRRLEFPSDWTRMRKRRFFGSMSQEDVRAGFALERQAINTACQGGAADVVSGALKATKRELRGEARLLLQVHDEILVERLDGWGKGSLARFRECCETGHGFELAVPLTFEAKEVGGWDEKSGGSARHVSSGFQKRIKDARSEGLQSRKASGLARKQREAAKA